MTKKSSATPFAEDQCQIQALTQAHAALASFKPNAEKTLTQNRTELGKLFLQAKTVMIMMPI